MDLLNGLGCSLWQEGKKSWVLASSSQFPRILEKSCSCSATLLQEGPFGNFAQTKNETPCYHELHIEEHVFSVQDPHVEFNRQ